MIGELAEVVPTNACVWGMVKSGPTVTAWPTTAICDIRPAVAVETAGFEFVRATSEAIDRRPVFEPNSLLG